MYNTNQPRIFTQSNHCQPIRNFWSFSRKSPSSSSPFGSSDLGTIEKAAEAEPDNPRKQAALYRVIIYNIISTNPPPQ